MRSYSLAAVPKLQEDYTAFRGKLQA